MGVQTRPPMLTLRPWVWIDPKPYPRQFEVEAALVEALRNIDPEAIFIHRRRRE